MARLLTLTAVLLWVLAAGAVPVPAQPSEEIKDLRKDVDGLKERQKAIQKDLDDLKNILRGRVAPAGPPQEVVLSIEGAPFKGEKNANLTLVDFTDYQ